MIAPSSHRRLFLVSAAAAALGAACAGLDGPQRITFTLADIGRLLERQFPQDRRVLEVLDVTMNTQLVRLITERNRIGALLDVNVRERVLGGRWSGKLDFDAALRWESRDSTLRLFQARVADLKLTSAGPDVRTPAERLGAALAERALEDMVLYTLPAERAEALRALGVAPGAVLVTSRGVEVTFAPASRRARGHPTRL
jgi:hypothetical protein